MLEVSPEVKEKSKTSHISYFYSQSTKKNKGLFYNNNGIKGKYLEI